MFSFRATILLVVVQSILLLGSVDATVNCFPDEICCTDYSVMGKDGQFHDGVNQFCALKSRGCQSAQGPDKDGKCQSVPNKNRIPPCNEGTYCCIKYTQTTFEATFPQRNVGWDYNCQAVNTGCPEFFQGYGTTDCSQHYPNRNMQPVYDCPAAQKCCWTKPGKWIDGDTNDKVLMTCVPVNKPCPQDLKSQSDNKCPRT